MYKIADFNSYRGRLRRTKKQTKGTQDKILIAINYLVALLNYTSIDSRNLLPGQVPYWYQYIYYTTVYILRVPGSN